MSRAPKRGAKVVFFSELAKHTAIYFQGFPHNAGTRKVKDDNGRHHDRQRGALNLVKLGRGWRNSAENPSSSHKKCVIL